MTAVTIEWDDREWLVDTEEITIEQAFVIKESTKDESWPAGRGLQRWMTGISEGEPGCLRGLYWLMLQQDGQPCPIHTVKFAAMKYHGAWTTASVPENMSIEQKRLTIAMAERQLAPIRASLEADERREAEAAAEPERPTQPTAGANGRPSPESASSTTRKRSAAPRREPAPSS